MSLSTRASLIVSLSPKPDCVPKHKPKPKPKNSLDACDRRDRDQGGVGQMGHIPQQDERQDAQPRDSND